MSHVAAITIEIKISGRESFLCPVGWTVEVAEGRIRDAYVLEGGTSIEIML
jgi:hypothetical protein